MARAGMVAWRNRIDADARVVDRCPGCGASAPSELVLEGEQTPCIYCGAAL